MDPAVDQIRLSFDSGSLILLNVILGVLMLGVALDIRVADFVRIVRDPRGPLIGLVAQFLLLPAATFGLTLLLDPVPSVALGMILVAACPGGNISNFLVWFARGNAALSVGMTAISTATAVVMTPVNIAFWGSLNPKTNAILHDVALDPVQVFLVVLTILGIPLALGMTLGARYPGFVAKVRKPLRITGATIFLGFIAVAILGNWEHIGPLIFPIFGFIILHNVTSLSLGYGTARALRVPAYDARAIAIEVGIQNSGLGLALIFDFFDGMGGMAVVAAGWGVWHIVAGLTLATFWSRRPVPIPAGATPPAGVEPDAADTEEEEP